MVRGRGNRPQDLAQKLCNSPKASQATGGAKQVDERWSLFSRPGPFWHDLNSPIGEDGPARDGPLSGLNRPMNQATALPSLRIPTFALTPASLPAANRLAEKPHLLKLPPDGTN